MSKEETIPAMPNHSAKWINCSRCGSAMPPLAVAARSASWSNFRVSQFAICAIPCDGKKDIKK